MFAFSEIKIPPDVINYPLHVIKLLLLRQQTHTRTHKMFFSDAARELRGNFSYFRCWKRNISSRRLIGRKQMVDCLMAFCCRWDNVCVELCVCLCVCVLNKKKIGRRKQTDRLPTLFHYSAYRMLSTHKYPVTTLPVVTVPGVPVVPPFC